MRENLANSCDYFRYDRGYEDVFVCTDTIYTYAQAEPYMNFVNLCCIDYEANGDGTYSVRGDWYPMRIEHFAEMEHANECTAATIIGAEYAHAYSLDPYEIDPDCEDEDMPHDVGILLEVATYHLLDIGLSHEAFSWRTHEEYDRWRAAFQKSGIDCM